MHLRPLICGLLLGLTVAVNAQDSLPLRASRNIKSENLSRYLHRLASDEFEGRETGQKGQRLAAEYIAKHFQEAGIPPIPALNGYFQQIPLVKKQTSHSFLEINGKAYSYLKDFYFFPGFEDTTLTFSSLEFIGYGIKESNYNDYSGIELENKALVLLDGEPLSGQGLSLITGKQQKSEWSSSSNRRKLFAAREHKPSAVFIVVDSVDKKVKTYAHFLESSAMKLNTSASKYKGVPAFFISREMGDQIALAQKTSVAELKNRITESGQPYRMSIPVNVRAQVKSNVQQFFAQNVLGYVEGTDLKEELIVISAHYDHLGKSGDKIYYGADDDGSGTSAVMELASAFAKAKAEGHGPRRSILFMAVAGEEKGLLGSEYYTSNPVFPLKNTVADLNIDMIGRLDEKHSNNPDYVYIIGSDKLSTDLHRINETANATYMKLELDYTYNDPEDKNRFYYRSDHYNFAKHNIPIIFYFNGVHADYHKHTDTVDKINFGKIEKITRLVFHTAWELANRNERIKVDVTNNFKNDR
jgi:hypothetical protein